VPKPARAPEAGRAPRYEQHDTARASRDSRIVNEPLGRRLGRHQREEAAMSCSAKRPPARPASLAGRASRGGTSNTRKARKGGHGLPTVPRPSSARPVLGGRPDAASTNAVALPSPLSLLETDSLSHATGRPVRGCSPRPMATLPRMRKVAFALAGPSWHRRECIRWLGRPPAAERAAAWGRPGVLLEYAPCRSRRPGVSSKIEQRRRRPDVARIPAPPRETA